MLAIIVLEHFASALQTDTQIDTSGSWALNCFAILNAAVGLNHQAMVLHREADKIPRSSATRRIDKLKRPSLLPTSLSQRSAAATAGPVALVSADACEHYLIAALGIFADNREHGVLEFP